MPSPCLADHTMLRQALHDLPAPVTMHYYTSDVDSWYSFAERQLLTDIANAAPALTLHIHPERWDAQRETQLGIRRTPAIALYDALGQDTGIRYYGMPDGYELDTFLQTLRAVAMARPALHPDTMTRLQQLTQPVHLEVVVSPT